MDTETPAFPRSAWAGVVVGLALVAVSISPTPARAQDDEAAPAEGESAAPLLPPPSPEGIATPGDSVDTWIQLNSGEWLRGHVDKMRDDVLEFDSEKFDDQSIDWDDVVQLRSPRTHRYVREFEYVHIGTAIIDREMVRIQTEGEEVAFPRSQLTAILPGDDRERSRWSLHLGLSVDANYGASEQVSLSSSAWLQREDYNSRTRLSFDSSWGQSDGTVNVFNGILRLRSDLYISRDFYVTPVDAAAMTDRFLNIYVRVAPGAGGGVHLVDKDELEWDFGGSMAYVFSEFVSVEAGEDPTSHDLGVRMNTSLEWDITGDIDFDVSHESLLIVTYFDLSTFTTKASLSLEVIYDFDLDLAFRHTRIREPVTSAGGVVPDNDQFQLTIGFSWTL